MYWRVILGGNVISSYLWTWQCWGCQRRRWQSRWRSASGSRWCGGASGARSWLGQTYVHHGTCCRRHPDRNGGYHHHAHVGYVPRHGQFPRTQHLSGGLGECKMKSDVCFVCFQNYLIYPIYSGINPLLCSSFLSFFATMTCLLVPPCITHKTSHEISPILIISKQLTSFVWDCIWLTCVLEHFKMHEVHNVWPDGGPEHSRKCDILVCGLPLLTIYGNQWTRSLKQKRILSTFCCVNSNKPSLKKQKKHWTHKYCFCKNLCSCQSSSTNRQCCLHHEVNNSSVAQKNQLPRWLYFCAVQFQIN